MVDAAIMQDIKELVESEAPRSFAPLDWSSYAGKAPEALIELWKASGSASWSNGSYQTIDPADFMSSTREALKHSSITANNAIPYIISAFGRVTVWHPDFGIITIDPLFGRNIVAKDPRKRRGTERGDIEILSGFPIFSADNLNVKLFDGAVSKLGMLERNEIFAFVPALLLGGRAIIDHIEKQMGDVHLDILSQSAKFETFYVEGDISNYKLIRI